MVQRGRGISQIVGGLVRSAAIRRGEGPRTQISAPSAPATPPAPPTPAGVGVSTGPEAGPSGSRFGRLNRGRFSFNIGGGSDSSGSGLNVPQ
jgi:hypothetical protein